MQTNSNPPLPAPCAASMYETVMGEAFERLSEPLKRFHRSFGSHEFQGFVNVEGPASPLAWLLAVCVGSPLKASQGDIRFVLRAQPGTEVWTRHFPEKTMRSRLAQEGARVVERLGAARLAFDLLEVRGRLEMRLAQMHFLGIRCPEWLMPQVIATEHSKDDALHFRVQASIPLVGIVAHYHGHLEMPVAALDDLTLAGRQSEGLAGIQTLNLLHREQVVDAGEPV